ncbi:GntR family transcriptional regulator, partial [Enterococcus faecium]|uniref:GntR family transcriptional regulator n=1 Tax=Enterococcus faecium TaxID=1352 RepID=UPI0031819266
MPKYKEIALALKERIVEGKHQEGSKLPEQESLAREFKTSRVTIRKAIQLLIDEGLLYTRRGSGTFIRSNIRQDNENVTQVNNVFGTSSQENTNVTSKIIRFDVRFPTDYERRLSATYFRSLLQIMGIKNRHIKRARRRNIHISFFHSASCVKLFGICRTDERGRSSTTNYFSISRNY